MEEMPLSGIDSVYVYLQFQIFQFHVLTVNNNSAESSETNQRIFSKMLLRNYFSVATTNLHNRGHLGAFRKSAGCPGEFQKTHTNLCILRPSLLWARISAQCLRGPILLSSGVKLAEIFWCQHCWYSLHYSSRTFWDRMCKANVSENILSEEHKAQSYRNPVPSVPFIFCLGRRILCSLQIESVS